MAGSGLASLVAQRLRLFPQLDPQASLAVASQEGLGGGVGDNGTSFGPYQLHEGGAYPSWAPQDPQQAQAWAWSPQGIDYALRQQSTVAGGLRGPAAVNAIVTRFERPANPQAEIAGALRSYGGGTPASPESYTVPSGPVSTVGQSLSSQLLQAAGTILNGGSPNLQQLFNLAAAFQKVSRPAPMGKGTPLAQKAGAA